ncbi:hypothetical protein [Wolbachia endosymbiont of Ctenocephalides felis wCfeT]|uniref:hypothetical protein n=1 Tax=Wolbachia endosymbiont of Ctenocephalides felis wCfeT TaxID=2732593 RepID=UPI001FE464DF|nr:hypothetical protein [Wolbachia endosymbiont of Ctenocephalides felis wCfeT]
MLNDSYTHLALEKYGKSDKKPVYIETAYDAHAMYKELFSGGFLIVGKSSLTAEQGSASDYIDYGKGIGADIVIASFQNKQRVKEYIKRKVPGEESITIHKQDNIKKEIESKTITVQKDKDVYIPYSVTHFDQEVLFLRRIGNAKAPWEYVKEDFTLNQNDSKDPYLGSWRISRTCEAEIYATKNEYLGFVNNCRERSKINKVLSWEDGDIKLRMNKQSKQGFYLDQDKIPVLVKFQINKSGCLELIDGNTGKVIAFFETS